MLIVSTPGATDEQGRSLVATAEKRGLRMRAVPDGAQRLVVSEQPGDLVFIHYGLPDGSGCDPERFVQQAYAPLAALLTEQNCVLVSERIFGETAAAANVLAARQETLAPVAERAGTTPTYIEGRPCRGRGVAGLHAIAVRAVPGSVGRAISSAGTVCGRFVEGQEAFFLGLSDAGRMLPTVEGRPQAEETVATLDAVNETLAGQGWSFQNVRRTWFYLHRILDWYGEFNRARNATFRRLGLIGGQSLPLIPASTGIEGRNARGGACALDLLATAPRGSSRHEVRRLTHAKQNEATEYGSAFARGLLLRLKSAGYAFVSGTASIDEHGNSVCVGDFEAQTRCTFEAVKSLLAAGGAAPSDICQGTAFLKRAEDLDAYHRVAAEQGFGGLPIVCTVADVCRDELLFELDATAIVA
jgi:enamine deaminase RidA (YjgF/YER057c/UK114 family)